MNLTEKYNIKSNQFYTALRSRNSMTMDEAYECLKTTSAGHDRDGMTSDAIKFFVKYGLAHRSKNRLHFIDVKNSKKAIAELALEMAEHTSMQLSNRKIKKMQSKPQDIVQPTLFTGSVMREQEQPIVTANDQLIHRINVLETIIKTHDNSAAIDNLREEMNKTFASILKRIGEESIKLDDLKDEHHKQRNGLINFIDKSMIALNSLLETL